MSNPYAAMTSYAAVVAAAAALASSAASLWTAYLQQRSNGDPQASETYEKYTKCMIELDQCNRRKSELEGGT